MPNEKDKPSDLRATIVRAYDAMEQREGKPRREPLKPLRHELSRLQDRERFIALCRKEWAEEGRWKRDDAEAAAHGYAAKTPPRGVVKEWVAEYRRMMPDAANCAVAHFSFPIIYASYVAALAQGESDVDLCEETVRRLLGGGTLDDSVMRLRQRELARKPRRDALQKVIDGLVAKNPKITPAGLWNTLQQSGCPGTTIEEVSDDTIEWTDAKGQSHDLRESAIKHRLSRAKKALEAKKTSR